VVGAVVGLRWAVVVVVVVVVDRAWERFGFISVTRRGPMCRGYFMPYFSHALWTEWLSG
jgi:hypothetical protein